MTMQDETGSMLLACSSGFQALARTPEKPARVEARQLSPSKEHKAPKQWYRCSICTKAYEREETLTEHMGRHKNQMKKRQQRLQESQDMEHAIKAPRTASATSVKATMARLKFFA
ncbi:unnamed protein product [Aphanomyces euteiches]|uniref:C2H2-type domain-containing protein n=1 Tax=Aphanomyces euteiches TaxID=100861 RepID=A0A6G0WW23_9STRA|nr:hypothetical protein Ae201684_011047 [Aphanomyces euteiches]KAH9058609.1 hypothetical protein Ae201684P_005952 [Aphanomyces euteiches]KAH9132836.1 hypothetical protein AeRB84_020900 [Aphanomyces euteiches]